MSNSPEVKRTSSLTNSTPGDGKAQGEPRALLAGNREVVTDRYFGAGVEDEQKLFAFKAYVRLGALKGTVFRKVSFQHSVFDGCYLTNCVFDSCDFTGCRFIGTNFHQTKFTGCNFRYATFERTQIDDDVLTGEAPLEENLRMRFARSLRMNYSQLGDAKAVNSAISLELEATAKYLRNSWSSKRSYYYQKKYPGIKQAWQFFRWLEFVALDVIWGNGESILKLTRSMAATIFAVAVYDVIVNGNPRDIADYWDSLRSAPAVFLGVLSKTYSPMALSLIAGSRYVGLALLTALLVKRFGRR